MSPKVSFEAEECFKMVFGYRERVQIVQNALQLTGFVKKDQSYAEIRRES